MSTGTAPTKAPAEQVTASTAPPREVRRRGERSRAASLTSHGRPALVSRPGRASRSSASTASPPPSAR
ncbi:hypothetical protein ABZT26_28670 [Streptomyces sp. NPDC005395]|uniref:hypothetical protein n=1 Tax=Streptomyces TaxID=1883 RepID=UPI001F08BB99|nr:hypothetical protein [Streptomyces salinarius]